MESKKKLILLIPVIALILLFIGTKTGLIIGFNNHNDNEVLEKNTPVEEKNNTTKEPEVIEENNESVVIPEPVVQDDKTQKEPTKEPAKEPVKEPVKEPTKEPVKNTETKKIDVSSIEIINKEESLSIGNKVTLKYKILPDNASDKSVSWTSSDTNIATVSNGEVTAKKEGTATITVKTSNGKTSNARINVISNEIKVTGININPTSKSIYVGEKTTLITNIFPTNATNKNITWTSSNTNIATVDNGVVYGVQAGEATITAKTNNGISSTSKITVINREPVVIKPTSVKLNKNSETIYTNSNVSSVTLKATVYPENALDKSVTWTSSDTNVATVSNGTVTIKGLGTTNITVKTNEGNYTDKYVLTVKKRVIIVIGASQVGRMNSYVSSYNSSSTGMKYLKSNGTLNYVVQGGSATDYQVNTGFTNAKQNIIYKEKSLKNFIEYHIFFPIAGNEISKFTCTGTKDEWYIRSSNEKMKNYAKLYNDRIKSIKSEGYNVTSYVVSCQPVVANQVAEGKKIVVNNNANACVKGYRSNVKYYTYNTTIGSMIKNNYSSNLKYLNIFDDIMVTNSNGTNYSWKYKNYNTVDGMHWDEATSKYYVKLMLDKTNAL